MTLYNILTLAVVILGWAFTYGKIVQKTNEIDLDVKSLDKRISKEVDYRNANFVSAERYNECVVEIRRRLDDVNIVDLNSRLSSIETLLKTIQDTLNKQ
jgi:hypothetical protein